ncbi:MarC family protein [Cohaesibacter haloalkalitolerans]|uniref:MarC family protein n=1 Tax=Cohaesibacter haloalkalitolerans TaxID=1162980 RepID=UPI000E652549|nr:MarC family protein [Cohaesibacter haloalkalitolerans]
MTSFTIVKMFGVFFAIMNPFVNLPIFLSLTDGFGVAERKLLAIKVVLFSSVMCLVILFGGQAIISFFGISVDDFRIAGGAVLAHIAWSMLNGDDAASHHGSDQENENPKVLSALAFYPLTFPMIVGPGTIATLIIYSGKASGLAGVGTIAAVLAVILVMLLLVFYFASLFSAFITQTMRIIMMRLMGMILLAIAVEMIISGLRTLLPGLLG